MNTVIEFVKDNPEAFAGIVAFLAIFGGVLGNWISAKVQAASGKAQASAARDAAWIAAEAQRLATLHTDRRSEIAAFIRAAREAVKNAELMYVREGYEEPAQAAYTDLTLKQAELELIAPGPVVELADVVVDAVKDHMSLAFRRAAATRTFKLVTRIRAGEPGHQAAHWASSAMEALRTVCEAEDNEDERQAFRSAAGTALDDVPGLTREQAELLLQDAPLPAVGPLKLGAATVFDTALRDLVTATRRLLRADDVQRTG
ncbi:hypothetical protein [Streptomyces atratus]|uniref:hypothetical protein n=1 Tax=Streptomyces atratus TaxID=1893 RepID=UPI00365123D1